MKKKLIIVMLFIMFVGIIAIIVNPIDDLSKQERDAALIKLAGGKSNLEDKQVINGDLMHKGKFISFLYPASSKVYQQFVNGKEVQNKGALDYFSFDLENPKVYVVTEVIAATSSVASVTDYPSVGLRFSQPNLYEKSEIKTAEGIEGISFAKSDSTGFEKTMFFYRNNKIFSFSVISVDDKKMKEIFNKILSTLKFL